ncbi:uncharacterized protein LOC144658532 [Oculina patagonica]
MARLLIHLLLGFCIINLRFINNVNAGDEVEADEDSWEDEGSSIVEDGGEIGDSSNEEDENEDEDSEDEDDGDGGNDHEDIAINIDFGEACVSGEMKVNVQTIGLVRVSELSVGDIIFGITGADRKPAWCKVEAVFPSACGKDKITHDGFTTEHMVIGHAVHPHGRKREVRIGPVYTLTIDCDASVNAAGQDFSPISTAFCPHELSWSEYVSLMSAIRRVTTLTGYFWFDTSAYHDNETAMVPHWFDQLHQICHHLLLCSREDRCQGFEDVMAEFVHEHLNREYIEVVERVFPNMGGDVNKQQAGTITEVVRPQSSCHQVLFSSLGITIVVFLDLFLVIALIALYHMQKKSKALSRKESSIPIRP